MIPFSKLLQYGNIVQDGVVLDVDYRNSPLGSNSTTDARGNIFTYSGSSTLPVVVSTELGNAMQFNTNGLFRTPISSDLNMLNKKTRITIKFKSTSSVEQIAWMTGDYSSSILPGFELILNNNLGTQIFSVNSTGQFERSRFSIAAGWNEIQVDYDDITKSLVITNLITSEVIPFTLAYGIGSGGTHFAIGGSYGRLGTNSITSGFIGQILYCKIQRL